MKLKKFQQIIKNTPDEVREDIQLAMDILERIHELLDEKFSGKQKLLAEKLNKSEAEVSKWLSGVQNFTTKTLSKLQVAFGEPIIAVCTKNDNSTFTQVKVTYKISHAKVLIDGNGKLKEQKTTFEEIKNSNITSNFQSDLLV